MPTNKESNMNVLISGVAGFIGSTLAQRMIEEEHCVTGVDNFAPYYSRDVKRDNLALFAHSDNFSLIESSIADIDESVLDGIEIVFHLAGQPGVRASFGESFNMYVDNNIAATQALLEKLKKAPCMKRLVYASSSSVYGDTSAVMLSENDVPRPVSPYGVTKLDAENLCVLYSKISEFSCVALRYFTVYGPRQRPDMAFNKFIKAIVDNGIVTLYGDGNQMRDFTFVEDTVRATMSAATADIPEKTSIINIGSGTTFTMNHVLEYLHDITGKSLNIDYKKSEKGDMNRTYANIEKAAKLLGYNPTISLYDGLCKEYEWFAMKRTNREIQPMKKTRSNSLTNISDHGL